MPRRRLRRRSVSRVIMIGGACLLALLYYRPVRAYMDARHTLTQRTAELRTLQVQHRALQARVAATANSGDIVAVARRLGYVRPGERLFIVKGIKAWARAHPQHQVAK